MDEAAALRGLREARNMNRHAKSAKERADERTDEAVVDAFRVGLGISRIAAEIGISESKVRAIRDKHGIAPDPRYAHLKPPTKEKEA